MGFSEEIYLERTGETVSGRDPIEKLNFLIGAHLARGFSGRQIRRTHAYTLPRYVLGRSLTDTWNAGIPHGKK